MCVMSMVHDHYWDKLKPYVDPVPQTVQPFVINQTVDLSELRKLIEEFKAAVEAAKTVDRLTMQPDCVDPEKAKLQQRVAELEKKLADIAQAAAT